MIKLFTYLFFVLYLSFMAYPKHVKVYLIAGQSNAAGAGFNEEFSERFQEPQYDVEFWNGGRLSGDGMADYKSDRNAYTEFGPLELGSGNNLYGKQSGFELSLGRTLKDLQSESNIAIIKYAMTGSSLEKGLRNEGAGDWYSGDLSPNNPYEGIRYKIFKNSAVLPALQAITSRGDSYSVEALFWMQGETDAGNSNAANNYEANLKELINNLRKDFNSPDMKFFTGVLRARIERTYLNTVRTAMQNVADTESNVYLVNTDDLALNEDNLHFSSAGLEQLGERFAMICLDELAESDILSNDNSLNKSNPHLHCWYRSDFGVETNGDEVLAWRNYQGVDSRDLNDVFGSGSLSPTLEFDSINEKPAIRFNNSKGIRALQTHWGVLSGGVTVFAVVQHNNENATDYVFDSADIEARNILCSLGNINKWAINGGLSLVTGDIQPNQFQLHEVIFDGSESTHSINNILVGYGNSGTKSFAGITLGTHVSGAGNSLDGMIAEFIVYKKVLNTEERECVRQYLQRKYNLSPICGGQGIGYPQSDFNQDCNIDMLDFGYISGFCFDEVSCLSNFDLLISGWLRCVNPSVNDCARYEPFFQPITDVFWRGMNGVNAYRIPSVVTSQNGVLIAICEARKNTPADMSATKIVVRRSIDKGKTWQEMQTIIDVGDDAAMDPTAVVDEITGKIWVFYEVFPAGWSSNPVAGLEYPSCLQWCMYSKDDGKNWSEPINITSKIKDESWYGFVFGPGTGIQIQKGLHKGRLVIPAHNDRSNFIIYSDDNGINWQRAAGTVSNLPKGIECQVVELEDGDYLMNIRNQDGGFRMISRSPTNGNTWSPAVEDDELIEPICSASILRYMWQEDGMSAVLFSNPNHHSERVNLTVRLSYDDCANWDISKSIYSNASGYSSLTKLKDNTIGCLFENGENSYYEKISFARFNYDYLID